MTLVNHVKGLARKIAGSIAPRARIHKEAKQHGKAGASLREEIRRCSEDDLTALKTALLSQFLTFSNRKRDAWLSENGVEVQKIAGCTYRQSQQRAFSGWINSVRDGVI